MRAKKYVLTALCLTLLCLAACVSSTAKLQTSRNSISMEFVLIPAGSFVMGTDPSTVEAEEADIDETPRYQVTITRPFYLGKYEVTQAQWVAVMGGNPSHFKGSDNPVEQVSWDDTQEFIRRLNKKEGHNRYRLPTEAEWEYAARAGTSSAYSFEDDKNAVSPYAWYEGNANVVEATRPVGQNRPNPWGLHDVHGNVWEWVQDCHTQLCFKDS